MLTCKMTGPRATILKIFYTEYGDVYNMHTTILITNTCIFFQCRFFQFFYSVSILAGRCACNVNYIQNALGSHSKEDKKFVVKTDFRLTQVKSVAKCSKGASCKTFDLFSYHLPLRLLLSLFSE